MRKCSITWSSTEIPVIGHSLGGVNAYQLAAAQPHRASALVIEGIGAVVHSDLSFALEWPERTVGRTRSSPNSAGWCRT